MKLRLTQNGQFHLIHNFSHFCHQSISFLEKSQNFLVGWLGGYISNFFEFSNFFNHFTPMWLKMTHNCKFGQNVLRSSQNGHFYIFSIFSPKMKLRLTRNGQFHLIHNFSIFCHQSISFWRNLKNFVSGGRYIGKFF